ncbi:hypothetical protein ANCCEY_07309 [Ancylostoma ceylanicum]|uniref:SCP domain-containing protein n=1 Tax=Ancylostoma ceylanicum TaxID=53326 RepID=A0A0D6M119_9BILA|nr:hypothetical protein ANCCEY_07309 [Ancylostoma ceylanicum]
MFVMLISISKSGIRLASLVEMSWHHTNRVGCATHACQGVKIIICKYAPPGRIIDQHIYTPGRPCQYCPGQCNTQLGLCTN